MTTEREARLFVWVSPDDCDPPHSLDLSPGSRDSYKVEWLTEAFASDGFDMNEPVLVGYPLNGRIQLVTGTHRHEAARRAGIRLPVHMTLRSTVEAIFGTDAWLDFVRDNAVVNLMSVPVKEGGTPASLADRIEPERDFARHG